MNTSTKELVFLTEGLQNPGEFFGKNLFFFIFCGSVSTIANSVIFTLIAKDKNLKSFFFALVLGHVAGRALYCFQNVIVGSYHTVAYFIPQVYNMTWIQCHMVFLPYYYISSYTTITTAILAIDRFHFLMNPNRYTKCSFIQGIYVSCGCAIFCILTKFVPSLFPDISTFTQVFCLNAQAAVSQLWYKYNYYTNLIFVCFTVLLYSMLFIFAFVRLKSKRSRNLNDEQNINRMFQSEMKLLNAVVLLIFANILTAVPHNILLILSAYYPDMSVRLISLGSVFSALDRTVDWIILFWKSSEIRHSFRSIFNQKTRVHPIN